MVLVDLIGIFLKGDSLLSSYCMYIKTLFQKDRNNKYVPIHNIKHILNGHKIMKKKY